MKTFGTLVMVTILMAVAGRAVLGSPQTTPALSSADSETLTFSETAFKKEREVVRRLYADEISHAEQLQSPFESVRMAIALADLNLSGRKDILAFLEHPVYCSNHGCALVVLIATSDSHWKIGLDNVTTYGEIRVSRHLTRGFRDLLLGGPRGYGVWRWDGEGYEYFSNVPY